MGGGGEGREIGGGNREGRELKRQLRELEREVVAGED